MRFIHHCILELHLHASKLLIIQILCCIANSMAFADQYDSNIIAVDGGKNYKPKAIHEVDEMLLRNNFTEAIILATNIINNKEIPHITPSYPNYVRSLAYNRRAQARAQSNGNLDTISDDYVQSALLGNLEAIREIEINYLESLDQPKKNKDRLFNIPPDVIDEILIIGADLGDSVSLKILAENNSPNKHEAIQIIYWNLMYTVSEAGPNTLDGIRKYKESDIKEALDKYSIVGDLLGKDIAPERDLFTVLITELRVRSALAPLLGMLPRKGKPAPDEEPTVIDGFQRIRTALEKSGLASAYLLTPIDVEDPAVGVINIDSAHVADLVKPGDSLYVSCGALSHVAIVFKVDITQDEILFVDPLYQYWNPEINSCIKTFSQKEFKHGLHLSSLKISEITPITTAILTIRKNASPEFMVNSQPTREAQAGDDDKTCLTAELSPGLLKVSKETALATDLFTWFNFELAETLDLESGRSRLIFRPKALRFRGYTAISMQINDGECIDAMSLFVRDVSQDDMETQMMLVDLIRNFLMQTTGKIEILPILSNIEAGVHTFNFEEAKIQFLRQKDSTDGAWSQIAIY